MDTYGMSVVLAAASAFLLGCLPFSALVAEYVQQIPLTRVVSRKFGLAQTYYLRFMTVPLLAVLIDFTKGIGAILLADLLLEKSDFSFIVAAVFIIMGCVFGFLLFSRKSANMLCLWGICAYLSPVLSIFVLPAALLAALVFNRVLAQFILAVVYLIYCISSGYPLMVLLYPLLLLAAMAYLYSDILLDTKSLFTHEWYTLLPVRKG